MTPRVQHVKFTYADYLLFPDNGKRHEIIDGDRFMTPAPSTKHQMVSHRLACSLEWHIRGTQAGKVFPAPTDVVLSDLDVVQPDLLFISAARLSIITESNIQGPPDLVVEILSEATRRTDSIIKRKLYERHGVLEYWLVDPVLETVLVYRSGDAGYVRAAELSREGGDALETPLLPGFRLSLSELFA